MESDKRQESIYNILINSEKAISGSELAKIFNVTRQIIVKDMGLLKLKKENIISTPKGYMINKDFFQKEITIIHSREKIEEELNIILNLGGRVINTTIEDTPYGNIEEKINISKKEDILNFLKNLDKSDCEPLLKLTNGKHKHLIATKTKKDFENILKKLKEKEYLIFE